MEQEKFSNLSTNEQYAALLSLEWKDSLELLKCLPKEKMKQLYLDSEKMTDIINTYANLAKLSFYYSQD